MLNKFKKQMKNEKGLTLIELLAVIVILAIVAAIAIPAIGNIIDNSRVKAVKADAQNVLSAANMYFTENGNGGAAAGKVTIAELKTAEFLEDEGSLTEGSVTKGKPNTFNGKGTKGNKTVTFTNATNKMIDDSEKSETVPKS